MFDRLKRHVFPIDAFFDYGVVLTYALPEKCLTPLLPPGLTLDTFEGFGFVAIALVQTRGLRLAGLPKSLGVDFFLSGYRIFTRYQRPSGQTLRGLRILRSDTDSRLMTSLGNALTHYGYRYARVDISKTPTVLRLSLRTPNQEADLSLAVDLAIEPTAPPKGSPFQDWRSARLFAGPLPFTFSYEKTSNSILFVEGNRETWVPRPVSVVVDKVSFFQSPTFSGTTPILANAFYIESIPYHWRRGILEKVSAVQ